MTHIHAGSPVIPSLEGLRADGWKVAIVANGPPTQADKLRVSGLAGVVDAWLVAALEGVSKPDPRIFEIAARRCGVPLKGWMVGDDPDADMFGARAVGLRTIWMARDRSWERDDFQPDAVAQSVESAAHLISPGPGGNVVATELSPEGGHYPGRE